MANNRVNLQNRLFLFTILFFGIGMIHISFAIIGIFCFTVPFYFYFRYKDKTWCRDICPRAGFFTRVIAKISIGLKPPKWLTGQRFRDGVVIYFGVNVFIILMSTLMVALGRVEPIAQVRFLIAFAMPFDLPQLLHFQVSDVLVHLGYRVYSMMFSSVILGVILGVLFRPRMWCGVCPVGTLTSGKGTLR